VTPGRDDYVHGTAPGEQRRLTRLNQLINRQSLERLRVRGGERVLDVGCGMGQFTRAIAGAGGVVVGFERSAEQIAEGIRQLAGAPDPAEIRAGDAFAFPLRNDEWGTFDVVHTRFLLEHLADPQRVVDAMVRAARPGGRIVVEDDDHDLLRLHPALPSFDAVWRAYMKSYETGGRDPRIGRRLPELLARAGADPVRCDWPFFGACHGSPDWDVIVDNCRAILSGARASILAAGIGEGAFDAGLRDYDAWCRERGAAFWYCTCWAEGVKPHPPRA
jgi:SAM-dependent methyltransferase